MTDPFESLRAPVAPVDPDPAFAATLRARLERALLTPEDPVTATLTETATATRLHTLTPMLRSVDARAAIEFYVAAFGAVRGRAPNVEPDGRVSHAEVTVGDSVVMIADENPGIGLLAPATGGGSGHALLLSTPDPDAVAAAAVAAGARLDRPVADTPYGRTGIVVDPDGHAWRIQRATTTAVTAAAGEADTITSYLVVLDARASVEFYLGALGATRRGEPIVMPDGRIGHAEVQVGRSVLMLAEEFPEMGLLAPVTRGGPSQSLHVETPDPDAAVAAALARGATLERPLADGPYGRTGVVVDPDGHRWMLSRSPAQARPGDVVYASLWTPDAGRAARFYGAVLDRELGRGLGSADHPGTPTLMCCYVVPDADAAAVLVRAAGGSAGEPHDEPYGRIVDAVDDQGLPFALVSGHAEPPEAGPGTLAYTEVRVPDAVRARAFYGTVLGRRFVPGGQEGFWHPEGHAGSTVLSGGHAEASVVPWFRVSDVAAASAAVRDAGGTAEPAGGTYGAPVACTDDQGVAFQLVGMEGPGS